LPTVSIPVILTNPRTASLAGNAYATVLALTNQDLEIWNFVKDVQGKVYGHVTVPKSVSAAPNAKIILIIGANATTGVTSIQVSQKAVASDAESVNVTFTAETRQDITVPGTARLHKKVTFTLTGQDYVAEDIIYVEVFHDGTQANDTLAVDTELYEAYLEIDVN